MFTGIVQELGKVREAKPSPAGMELAVECRLKAREGDSVCVNGVCLSARPSKGVLRFDVVHETLSRTNLGALQPGDRVNLEPSLRYGDPLGGHIVSGHVDAQGTMIERTLIEVPKDLLPYIVSKGSIAVDGVSLTVVKVTGRRFSVALIPLTLEKTTLGLKGKGDKVNIEVDLMARYKRKPSAITREFLERAGFIGKR
jgi:riboflavin synthase alpha subunit